MATSGTEWNMCLIPTTQAREQANYFVLGASLTISGVGWNEQYNIPRFEPGDTLVVSIENNTPGTVPPTIGKIGDPQPMTLATLDTSKTTTLRIDPVGSPTVFPFGDKGVWENDNVPLKGPDQQTRLTVSSDLQSTNGRVYTYRITLENGDNKYTVDPEMVVGTGGPEPSY